MCLAIVYKCREHRPAAAAARPMPGSNNDVDVEIIFFIAELLLFVETV
jgi:hypothetical protein